MKAVHCGVYPVCRSAHPPRGFYTSYFFTSIRLMICPIGAEIDKSALTVRPVSDLLMNARYFPRK